MLRASTQAEIKLLVEQILLDRVRKAELQLLGFSVDSPRGTAEAYRRREAAANNFA